MSENNGFRLFLIIIGPLIASPLTFLLITKQSYSTLTLFFGIAGYVLIIVAVLWGKLQKLIPESLVSDANRITSNFYTWLVLIFILLIGGMTQINYLIKQRDVTISKLDTVLKEQKNALDLIKSNNTSDELISKLSRFYYINLKFKWDLNNAVKVSSIRIEELDIDFQCYPDRPLCGEHLILGEPSRNITIKPAGIVDKIEVIRFFPASSKDIAGRVITYKYNSHGGYRCTSVDKDNKDECKWFSPVFGSDPHMPPRAY